MYWHVVRAVRLLQGLVRWAYFRERNIATQKCGHALIEEPLEFAAQVVFSKRYNDLLA